jgi:hypothetical protein
MNLDYWLDCELVDYFISNEEKNLINIETWRLSWCQSGHWQQSLPRCSCEAGGVFDPVAQVGDAPVQYGIFNLISMRQRAKLMYMK